MFIDFSATKSLPIYRTLIYLIIYSTESRNTMAENESKPADVDALAAMANGPDLNDPDPYVEQQAEIEPADDAPVAGDLAQFAPRPDSPTAPGPRPAVSNPRLVDAPPPMSRADSAKRLAAQT